MLRCCFFFGKKIQTEKRWTTKEGEYVFSIQRWLYGYSVVIACCFIRWCFLLLFSVFFFLFSIDSQFWLPHIPSEKARNLTSPNGEKWWYFTSVFVRRTKPSTPIHFRTDRRRRIKKRTRRKRNRRETERAKMIWNIFKNAIRHAFGFACACSAEPLSTACCSYSSVPSCSLARLLTRSLTRENRPKCRDKCVESCYHFIMSEGNRTDDEHCKAKT